MFCIRVYYSNSSGKDLLVFSGGKFLTLGRGRHQPFPQHHPGQVLDLHYYLVPSEVEWLVMVERPEEMN